ncbi:zinc finger protein 502-like isoform X2 [Branchiostoma lanceolatum]|uniref:zinc finger protein 502-like isoform X2 n=1 Tax=Branchiostoma lanceolatum TaxID=7740 RepID=UPI00345620E9
MGDKKRRQRRTKKSKRGKYLRALRLYRSGQVSRATATRNGKSDNGASRAETQLMEESLRPVAQVKTEQMRTPDTHQTIKEEDDQEKNLGNDDNNTTTSQLSCGTAGIDIKEEALDELEESLVSCCNSTAQLLSCDMVGADADKTDEEEMKLEDYCNVNTPSQLSCTISTVEDQQEMDLGNCSNTNTPCQLSCSTPCIEVEKEGGQETNLAKMKRHKLTLTEARPYKCEMKNCNSTFKRKYDLEKHVCSVHNRNRFPCPFEGCKQTYGVKSKMISHYKVHTGERSHQCSYCGKMYRRTGHLRVHMRIHTGDTPYNCRLCNYSGRQYNSLRWHMKTHHPEHCNRSGDKVLNPRKKAVLERDALVDNGQSDYVSGSAIETAT